MDFIYYIFIDFLHYSSIVFLVALIPIIIMAMAKPDILARRIRMFTSQKSTLLGSLASVIMLIGLVMVTSPTSLQQQRNEEATKVKQQQTNHQHEINTRMRNSLDTKLVIKVQDIPYEKHEKTDARLPSGQRKITQKGVNGEKTLTYEVEYKDGKEVSRKLNKEVIDRKPIAQIISVGTAKTDIKDNMKAQGPVFSKNKNCKHLPLFFAKHNNSCKH